MTDVAERLRAAGLAVKPLEWGTRLMRTGVTIHKAETPFGEYMAGIDLHKIPYWMFGEESHDTKSLKAAKAGAQADYESRILAALCSTLERSAHTPPEQGLDLDEAETRSDAGR
jgi:hypothetical protein